MAKRTRRSGARNATTASDPICKPSGMGSTVFPVASPHLDLEDLCRSCIPGDRQDPGRSHKAEGKNQPSNRTKQNKSLPANQTWPRNLSTTSENQNKHHAQLPGHEHLPDQPTYVQTTPR